MEHLLVALFGIGFPAITGPSYAKRRVAILAGDHSLRKREYRETIVWLSSMGVASIVFFAATGLDLSLLGLSWPDSGRGWVAIAVALTASGLLYIQLHAVRVDAATRAAARASLEPVREYFPTDPQEVRLFRGVSFAAGIGEELFYRGFLFWYFAQWLPAWAVLVTSSVLFGAAHLMHGVQALARSIVTGFVLGGLYLLGGSLIAPMILHTAVDLTSGETGAVAFAEDPAVTL